MTKNSEPAEQPERQEQTEKETLPEGGPPSWELEEVTVSWAQRNPGLLVAAAAFGLLLVHLIIISRGNATTALALLGSANATSVILGLLLTTLPIWLNLAFLNAGLVLVDAFARVRRIRRPGATVLPVLLLIGIFMLPVSLVILTGSSIVAYAGFRIWQRTHKKEGKITAAWETFGDVLALIFPLVVFSSQLWLPSEFIGLRDGREFVAYVVTTEAGWTTLLTEESRTVVVVPEEALVKRRVCSLEKGNRPISVVLREFGEDKRTVQYPECEALEADSALTLDGG